MIFPFPLHLPDPAGLYSRSIDIFFRREYFRRSYGIEVEG